MTMPDEPGGLSGSTPDHDTTRTSRPTPDHDTTRTSRPTPDHDTTRTRVLGLDLGERRIGVAVGNAEGRVATPLTVIERSAGSDRDHRRIAELVAEYEATAVVVGLPLSLDGGVGPAARRAEHEAHQLRAALNVPVLTHDERLTTVIAERALAESGLSGRARRRRVDMVAASVILQGWLDASNHRTPP